MIWTAQRGSEHFRSARNRAVHEAHAAGVSLEQIAGELGVLIGDVESMIVGAQSSESELDPA